MKKLFSFMNKIMKQTAGFTMIELLIVISILGILAVAVLAAINPIEQINRGRDTGSRSDAEQLISAIDRYYAFNGYQPWQTGAADLDDTGVVWTKFDDLAPTDDNACTISEKLSTPDVLSTCVGADELKLSFMERVAVDTYNSLYVFNNGNQGSSTYVCYAPKSKAFVTEITDRLTSGGTTSELPPTADYPGGVGEAMGNTAQCGADGNCICLP